MTPLEEEVKKKLEKFLNKKLVLTPGESFDIVDEPTSGAEIIIKIHDGNARHSWFDKNGQLLTFEEGALLREWHSLERKKNVDRKYLIFTDPQMFWAFKRLRNNTKGIQDKSVKLGLINYPVYDNSKGQIMKNCDDKVLTNAGIISLLRFGFLDFEKLDQHIKDNILDVLRKKNLLSWKKIPKNKVKTK